MMASRQTAAAARPGQSSVAEAASLPPSSPPTSGPTMKPSDSDAPTVPRVLARCSGGEMSEA